MKLLLVISNSLNINLPDFTLLCFSQLLLGTLLLTLSLLVLLIAFVVAPLFFRKFPLSQCFMHTRGEVLKTQNSYCTNVSKTYNLFLSVN